MDSNENNTSCDLSILDLQNQEKKEKQKKSARDYQKKRREKSGAKERENLKRQAKHLTEKLKKLGREDPHEMCKKLGHTLAYGRRNPDYFYRCTKCGVSYSDKEKIRESGHRQNFS